MLGFQRLVFGSRGLLLYVIKVLVAFMSCHRALSALGAWTSSCNRSMAR